MFSGDYQHSLYLTEIPAAPALEPPAKHLLEVILKVTAEGIFGVDLDGRCTFVNDSAASMLGFSSNRLLGFSILDLMQRSHDETRFVRRDGSKFRASVRSYPWSEGTIYVFEDITESLRRDRELREAVRRHRELFEHVRTGVYQTSPEGELLAANPALIELLGFSCEQELRALDVTDLYVDPRQRDQCRAVLEHDGSLRNAVLALRRKDGRTIHVVENARVVRAEDGRVLYYEGTLNEMSEQAAA